VAILFPAKTSTTLLLTQYELASFCCQQIKFDKGLNQNKESVDADILVGVEPLQSQNGVPWVPCPRPALTGFEGSLKVPHKFICSRAIDRNSFFLGKLEGRTQADHDMALVSNVSARFRGDSSSEEWLIPPLLYFRRLWYLFFTALSDRLSSSRLICAQRLPSRLCRRRIKASSSGEKGMLQFSNRKLCAQRALNCPGVRPLKNFACSAQLHAPCFRVLSKRRESSSFVNSCRGLFLARRAPAVPPNTPVSCSANVFRGDFVAPGG